MLYCINPEEKLEMGHKTKQQNSGGSVSVNDLKSKEHKTDIYTLFYTQLFFKSLFYANHLNN